MRDVVLVSSTVFSLQSNLEVLDAEVHRAGLLVNLGKCCAVSLVASVHDHKVKVITQPSFRGASGPTTSLKLSGDSVPEL